MPYTDWIGSMEEIPNKKELSILEFGLGDGTRYLLDNFNTVFSHELAPDANWYHIAIEALKERSNWAHRLVLFDEIGFVDYNPILPKQLTDDIDYLFETYNFDVVFVDGGYHVRGDIANYILNKFQPKFVVIHDTNFAFEEDGYGRIKLPDWYELKRYTEGEGTIVFTKITRDAV